MKITKKLLNGNKIYNSHGIAMRTGNNPFIYFSPAERGKVNHPAKYQVIHYGYQTDSNAAWYDHDNKTFNAFGRDEKEPKLAEAKVWVKERYGLDITERDVWGNWHVTGTMAKLEIILKEGK